MKYILCILGKYSLSKCTVQHTWGISYAAWSLSLGRNNLENFVWFCQTKVTLLWKNYPNFVQIQFCFQGLRVGGNKKQATIQKKCLVCRPGISQIFKGRWQKTRAALWRIPQILVLWSRFASASSALFFINFSVLLLLEIAIGVIFYQ